MRQIRLSSALERVRGWFHARTRAQWDLIVIAMVAIPTYLVLLAFDAFDLVYDWTRLHEDWQLDELVALFSPWVLPPSSIPGAGSPTSAAKSAGERAPSRKPTDSRATMF